MTSLKITVIENFEGDGTCSACKREGLVWVATLSDGSQVGLECAKKVLGFKPTPNTYSWITNYKLEATHVEYGTTYGLWVSKTGNATRETQDGTLISVGGVRADWASKGWI